LRRDWHQGIDQSKSPNACSGRRRIWSRHRLVEVQLGRCGPQLPHQGDIKQSSATLDPLVRRSIQEIGDPAQFQAVATDAPAAKYDVDDRETSSCCK